MSVPYAIKVDNLKKLYRLGQIGGGTLRGDLSSWWARKTGKEDPNSKIGRSQANSSDSFYALNGINLTINQGEAVGIIGRNGAGKSTLLKLLSRVTAPTEGEIDIYGRVSSMLEVGTGFHGEMTGRENIYMNGAILGMSKAEIDAKMEDIIEFSEVREFIDTPVKRYSSGMYVKLAFSVAAHLDSEIMIMDEVLAVGDMAFQQKCLNKMREAATTQGRTVLYVSHNMSTIRQLCNRCIVLDQGKVVFDGDVEKAIEYYMGVNDSIKPYNEYSFADYAMINNQLFQINSIALNHEDCQYNSNELLELTMDCTSLKPLDKVTFRFQIVAKDNTRIGTSICTDSISINGNKKIKARIPIHELSPGQYLVEVAIHNGSPFDDGCYINTLKKGFYFEVINSVMDGVPTYWHKNWGIVHFDDASAEVINDGE